MVAVQYTTVTESVAITSTTAGAGANVVYTVPPFNDATVEFLHVTNGGSSTDSITIQWYHKERDTYYELLHNKAVAGNDVYNMITSDRLHLHAGDKIVAYNGGGLMSVVISAKEYYNPTRGS